jgi:uncharacterized cupredoxin-like copper-binding protein
MRTSESNWSFPRKRESSTLSYQGHAGSPLSRGRRFETFISTVALVALVALPFAARAHGEPHAKTPAAAPEMVETDFGRTGDPKRVNRTIWIAMSDAMRFAPAKLEVKQGETIRFVVKNGGQTLHEMVLGTLSDLKAHAEQMRKHPGMEHDEPYMAHVAPGKSAVIVWQFTRAGEFHYGCLVPGHFEAGMVGSIKVIGK